jgi:curli biogenesis system outer membrane secretion channel CsgG
MRTRSVMALAMGVACLVALSVRGEAAEGARSKRPTIAVMDFDFGTVGYHWWGDADIGKGMADQVVDALVNDGSFRVIERKKLDTVLAEQDFSHSDRAAPSAAKMAKLRKVLGVQYIIAGSITKFGGEEKTYGGSGYAPGKLGGFGGLGIKKAKTEVSLTARIISSTTAEILVSAKGEGVSNKGGGLAVAARGSSFDMGSSDYKASAIGEAQEMACNQLVAAILAKKNRIEEE